MGLPHNLIVCNSGSLIPTGVTQPSGRSSSPFVSVESFSEFLLTIQLMFMASFVFLSNTLKFSSAALLFQHPLMGYFSKHSHYSEIQHSPTPEEFPLSKQPHLKATLLFTKRWERSTAFKAFDANEFLNSSTIAINFKNIISNFNTLPTFIFMVNDHSHYLFQHIKA